LKYHLEEERGFSLVEMLIAMTLGLILISSMIAVFSGNKRSSELNAATADLQESARYALEQISRDARMAGYLGCLSDPSSLTIQGNSAPTTSFRDTTAAGSSIQDGQIWSPPILGFNPPATNPAKAGTHALLLQYAGPDYEPLVTAMNIGGIPNPSADIVIDNNGGLGINDLAIISNCEYGNLFQISNIVDTAGNTVVSHAAASNSNNGAFRRPYGVGESIDETRLMKFNSNIYYIGDNGLVNESNQPLFSLYQQSLPYNPLSNPPVELVTGVENFKVTFGVRDPVTNGVRFVPADSPQFVPSQVNAVRIGILMVSYDEVAEVDDTNTYVLAGTPITPAGPGAVSDDTHPVDRRIRLAFNTTVQIRNRRDL